MTLMQTKLIPFNDFEISLDVRKCLEGEELLPNGKCQECAEGKYLLISPSDQTLCKNCPSS